MSDFVRPKHWKEEAAVDLGNVTFDTHDWERIGNQLVCRTQGHYHACLLLAMEEVKA